MLMKYLYSYNRGIREREGEQLQVSDNCFVHQMCEILEQSKTMRCREVGREKGVGYFYSFCFLF